MNLSFTLDEKVFSEISPESLIEKACSKGVSSLELSPDIDVLTLEVYKNILNLVSQNKLDINYHIPYFANNIYELEYFSLYEDKLKSKYISFFNLLELFQDKLDNDPVIVIHGSDYDQDFKSKAMDNTLKFLDWSLNFISKKNLPFTIALETLRTKSKRNTLDNREDIFSILSEFNSDKIQVCWDICHDKLNFYPDACPIDSDFLNKIIYTHIHGHNIENDTSHISLVKNQLDYSSELEVLMKSSFSGSVNIELLSNFSEDYLNDLFKDIDYMNRFL